MTWALLPAAGSGRRFGGEVPKQYLHAAGKPLIEHALDALLSHPAIDGVVVALAAGDPLWPGWTTLHGKPIVTCIGGGERADSVFAALQALPDGVADDELLLVHDAARPNLCAGDIDNLVDAANACADGAIHSVKRPGSTVGFRSWPMKSRSARRSVNATTCRSPGLSRIFRNAFSSRTGRVTLATRSWT